MFGYIKPIPAELRVKEYELYKSIYCGLCASLGHNTTCISRLTLSYDFVFLALVRMALDGECDGVKLEKRRCIVHPTKKRSVLVGSKELDYCARVSALLTYGKLRDDINDERGFKRFTSRLLLPAASGMRKRALTSDERLSELDGVISARLAELSSLEAEKVYSPDAAAEPFGALMGEVFAFELSDKASERIARELGRHIGRFVYISDAADDLEDDLKKGCYNPFRIDGAKDSEILAEFASRSGALKASLIMELTGAERAVELIDSGKQPSMLEIIKNIIYLGLPAQIDALLEKRDKREA